MKVLKGEKFPERYCAVNLSNADTIEVRIFRGSLNERRVRSAIESIDCAIQYTRTLSVHDINQGALKFGMFADWVNENRAECASFIDLMCVYGLIPMVKKAGLVQESGIQSSNRTDLQDVNNSQRSLSVLTDNVDVPQCPNFDLHAELEN
jgi:preprotein translocase subunit Sec63